MYGEVKLIVCSRCSSPDHRVKATHTSRLYPAVCTECHNTLASVESELQAWEARQPYKIVLV